MNLLRRLQTAFTGPSDAEKSLTDVLETLAHNVGEASASLAAVCDPADLSARLSSLEGTIDRRLGEAAADLIEAKAEFRKARNAEQRTRDLQKRESTESTGEVSEDELDEIVRELRRELLAEHGTGSPNGAVQSVPATVGRTFIVDEYDG